MTESASAREVSRQLLDLLPVRRGHFQYESGDHGDVWLDLDSLFVRPTALRPIVDELAQRLSSHRAQAVCGPMIGGALIAQMVAEKLGIEFYFTERITAIDAAAVSYQLPRTFHQRIKSKPVAIIDDAINAGSAVLATLGELRTARANPVVVGALLVLGTRPKTELAAQKMPLEYLAAVSSQLWSPAICRFAPRVYH